MCTVIFLKKWKFSGVEKKSSQIKFRNNSNQWQKEGLRVLVYWLKPATRSCRKGLPLQDDTILAQQVTASCLLPCDNSQYLFTFMGRTISLYFYQALPIPLSHVPKNYMALFCRKPFNLLWDSIVPDPTPGLASDSSHLIQRRGTLTIQKLPSSSKIL